MNLGDAPHWPDHRHPPGLLNAVADLPKHRHDFPALDDGIYANFGARGVMARTALASVGEALDALQSVGPGSRMGQALITRETAALRQALASCLGVPCGRVALVENVSHACAAAFWGIDWSTGDHCLVGSHEPPGTWMAARQAAARFGIDVTAFELGNVDDAAVWGARLWQALRPTTRLVVLSHVDWITGAVAPLRQLVDVVRAGPAPAAAVAIDGAQAVGALAVDLSTADIDLYAVAGQKWLGGPDGVAGMVVPRAEAARIKPGFVGWRAVGPWSDGEDIALAEDAARFETGTAPFALFPGLREALRIADVFAPMSWRAARIAASTTRLVRGLEQFAGRGLHVLNRSCHGIVSFTLDGIPAATVVRRLEGRGVVAKAHAHPACTRLCVHYLTLDTEIDALLEAVADVSAA